VFFALVQANTNPTLQKAQVELAPKLAAHRDAIYLNAKLLARINAIYDQRDKLDPADKFLTERYHRDFVRAGALLSDADKSKLRALNEDESKLQTAFQNKLLAGTQEGALTTKDKGDLAGMSDGEIAAAAAAAKERKLDNTWLVTLQNTTQQPAQVELTNRGAREKLFKASIDAPSTATPTTRARPSSGLRNCVRRKPSCSAIRPIRPTALPTRWPRRPRTRSS
jgi:Zn-dependent oligopeptidases